MNKKSILLFFIFVFCFQFASNNCYCQTITGGSFHSFAICEDSVIRSWGNNYYGQLGNDTTFTIGCQCDSVSVLVQGLSGISDIAGGWFHSLALKDNGVVWAWGRNEYGQLGNGTIKDTTFPVKVSGIIGVSAIATKGFHSVALKNDSTVWAWGNNQLNELGDGSNIEKHTPVKVNGLTGIIAIAAGVWHSLALKNDGTVWAWGDNQYGELGDGTNLTRTSPVKVLVLTGIIAIAGGEYHSLALKSDGTIWAWGYNKEGELGDNTKTEKHSPVQVSLITGITGIAAGDWYSLALKNDGTIWAWGMNNAGQLGNVTLKNIGPGTKWDSVPRQVNGISGCTAIAAGREQSLALKNDGTLWAWGYNQNGQLGIGTTSIIGCNCDSIPTQVISICPIMQPRSFVTGINQDKNINNTETIYPNPSNGEFTLKINNEVTMNAIVEIFNVLGERVFQSEILNNITILNTDLKRGIYFYQIKNNFKVIASGKIMVE